MGGDNDGSGLHGLKYDPGVGYNDLARFVDSPLDGQIEAIVGRPAAALRESFTRRDFGTLWVFARRSGVRAVRAGDPQLAASGLWALAFVDAKQFDFRDVLVAAGLLAYCLDRTGGDRVAAVEAAVGHAWPATADHLRRFDGRDTDALRLTTWGLAEVEGEQGPCFIGWKFKAYEVTVDLATVALRVAGILDAKSAGARVSIASSLPPAWFPSAVGPLVKELAAAARGGATVHAAGGLICFIVETASENDARRLASWGGEPTSHHAALAVTDGQLLVLVVTRESTAEQLERFREPLTAAIMGLGAT